MWNLREAPYCVGTLNPHKEEGVKLVMEMLKQVVKLHPGLNTLHIGADEVRTQWLLTLFNGRKFHQFSYIFVSNSSRCMFSERGRSLSCGWPQMDAQ